MNRIYSLRKSRNTLKWIYAWYKKNVSNLAPSELNLVESEMQGLDTALLNKDRVAADKSARRLETFGEVHVKKSFWTYTWELVVALLFALVIATVVRQMWFELYEIPTGSMRPTFKEQDHLTVTKTTFGLNIPLKTDHFYFDPNIIQRMSVVIFSGDGLPLNDTETTYFWILPYTKRYIKRLMGKPGDSIYFYGGKIYSVDKNGNPVTELLDSPWLKDLEHVPMLSFKGENSSGNGGQVFFYQMHKPIGRILFSRGGDIVGEINNGKEWIKDNPAAQKNAHDKIETYSDFLGMRNYAMARLLTKDELKIQSQLDTKNVPDAPLYLELSHDPTLAFSSQSNEPKTADDLLTTYKTYIPLQDKHLKAIMDNMYTARFVVKNGKAARYSPESPQFGKYSPDFSGVPDGTYEFYYGKAYSIGWGAVSSLLPKDHPLYKQDPSNIQKLYNLGVEINNFHIPSAKNQNQFPNRYAYFRDGDLYILGAPILTKDDPTLIEFIKNENDRQNASTVTKPYIAFKDYGPPIKDGKYDVDFIRTFGMTIPDKHYLVLGDNHAMSGDSRVFGFVDENNLQGSPSLIIWPPGERWGTPNQKPYPLFTLPRLIVWTIVAIISAIWYWIYRRNLKKPIFKKIPQDKVSLS